MVFLFNKAKIFSYVVAVTTVIILFVVAANVDTNNIAIQASTTEKEIKSNIISDNIDINKIVNEIE